MDDLAEFFQQIFVHPQRVQTQVHHSSVKYTKHHRFPVACRQTGYTKVNGFAVHLGLDTSVLGYAPFRNIQTAQNLYAAGDRHCHIFRRRRQFIQSTVHAVTDAVFVFKRLKVDVTGFVFDRLTDHKVHKTHYRSRVGCRLQIVNILIVAFRAAHVAKHAHNILGIHRIIFFDSFVELFIRRHRQYKIPPEDKTQIIYCRGIQRITHGQHQRIIINAYSDHAIGAGGVGIDHFQCRTLDIHFQQIHHFQPHTF